MGKQSDPVSLNSGQEWLEDTKPFHFPESDAFIVAGISIQHALEFPHKRIRAFNGSVSTDFMERPGDQFDASDRF